MTNFKKFVLVTIALSLIFPAYALAFWPWSKDQSPNQSSEKIDINQSSKSAINQTPDLTIAAKAIADAKYKLWENSFEKKNVEEVIANQNNFWFTAAELTYLFNNENAKSKKPFLSNLELQIDDDSLKINTNFKKFIRGKASFIAKIKSNNQRLQLAINKAKLYGFSVPSSLIANPLNKEIDKYLDFLYKNDRYQGLEVFFKDDVIGLNLYFKE